MPAHRKILRDILHRGPRDPCRDIMPADRSPRRVVLGIPSVAMEVGQVDATDERDAIIDHDRLLMVAMHRPLPGVERTLNAAARHQLIANLSSIATPGPQHGQRRTGPDQHPNGKAGADVGEQLPEGVSPPCWRSGLGPAPFRRIDGRGPAHVSEPPPVM